MIPTGQVKIAVLRLSELLKSDSENDLLGNGQEAGCPASSHALGKEGSHRKATHLECERERVVDKDAGQDVAEAWYPFLAISLPYISQQLAAQQGRSGVTHHEIGKKSESYAKS